MLGGEASTVRVMRVDTSSVHAVAHTVNRLVIDTDTAFDDVLESYESLVPTVDFAKLTRLISSGDLSRVKQYTAEHAPHTFMNFWTFDPSPQMMLLFGHRTRAVTYMMGNNIIVERMFRHHPGVMLYAPLRTAIYQDADGQAHLSIDQPSTRFASFGDPHIAAVGLELDTKLAELLDSCRCPCPPSSSTTRPDDLCGVSLTATALLAQYRSSISDQRAQFLETIVISTAA